jgi:hypothetical protein
MFHNVYVSKNMNTKQGQQGRVAPDVRIPTRPSNTSLAAMGLAAMSSVEHQTVNGNKARH